MTLDLEDRYYKREQDKQLFIFKGKAIYMKGVDCADIPIIEFSDNLEQKSFNILSVCEYLHYAILFLNWPIHRNILIVDMKEKKIVWQVPVPKAYDKNWWRDYHVFSEQPDVVYCYADRYVAGFKIPTGELISEQYSNSGDPRDF